MPLYEKETWVRFPMAAQFKQYNIYGPLAQLDRAKGFYPLGWGFKFLTGRHFYGSVAESGLLR